MPTVKHVPWLLALVLAAGSPTHAQERADGEGTFASGAGTIACQTFLDETADTLKTARERQLLEMTFYQWAQGFMSGLLFDPNNDIRLDVLPAEAQREFLRDYCQENSGTSFVFGVLELLDLITRLNETSN